MAISDQSTADGLLYCQRSTGPPLKGDDHAGLNYPLPHLFWKRHLGSRQNRGGKFWTWPQIHIGWSSRDQSATMPGAGSIHSCRAEISLLGRVQEFPVAILRPCPSVTVLQPR